MNALTLLLLGLVLASNASAQDEVMDAVKARCMQNITVLDHSSEAKIRWQYKNCQEIWQEARDQLAVAELQSSCHEMASRIERGAHWKVKWILDHCTVISDESGQPLITTPS